MTSLALMDNVIDLAGTQQEAASEPEEEEEDYDQTDSFYQLDSLLADCVSELGSVWGVMAVHGVYLSAYLRAQHLLLHSNSAPLPAPHRHMIGMMASARLSCAYLLAQHRAQLTLLAARGSSAGVSVAQLDRGLASFPAKVSCDWWPAGHVTPVLALIGGCEGAEAELPEHAAGAPAVADDAGARGAADAARARLLVPVRAGLLHHPHVPRPQPLLLRDELRHDGARHGGHQRPAQPRPGQLPRGGAHAADVRAEVSPGNTTNTSLLKAFYMSK